MSAWIESRAETSSFAITISDGVEEDYHAFARLLLNDTDWRKAQKSSRMPSSDPDASTTTLLMDVIKDRLSRYETTLAVSEGR